MSPTWKDREKALGKTFAVAATVHIEPLGIYSHKHKDFSSLPENATVAVPNNTTNLSRALFLLQAQKLISWTPNLPTRPPPRRRRRILSRTRNT